MKSVIKNSAIVLAMVSLSACLEVEDDNDNDRIVAALEQQNEILKQNNGNDDDAEVGITLFGSVKNLSTNALAINSSVKIKVGNDWSEPTAINANGSFELTGLPYNSDYTLVVTSNDDSFLSRRYYGTTRASETGKKIYQDLGDLSVSQGETKVLTVLDSDTNATVPELSIYARYDAILENRIGPISGEEQYYLTASYDEVTAQYEIMLPTSLPLNVYATLDTDSDGNKDYYSPSNHYYNDLIIDASKVKETSTVYLQKVTTDEPEISELDIRLSIVDIDGKALVSLAPAINDNVNGEIIGEYNEESQQYNFDTEIESSLNVLIPASTVDGQAYESSNVTVSKHSDYYRIMTKGYSDGYYRSIYYNLPLDTSSADIVIQLRAASSQVTDIKTVSTSTNIENDKATYRVFYSDAVALLDDSATLYQTDALSVVYGNDADDDLVLAGTTAYTYGKKEIASSAQLSLHNTLLTIESTEALMLDKTYQFVVDELSDSDGNEINVDNDSSEAFRVKGVNSSFTIEDLALDNFNFYSNGAILQPENTAGQASEKSYSYGSVFLVLPLNIKSTLKSFTIQKMIVTKDGNSANETDFWNILEGYGLNERYLITPAYNEHLIYEGANSYSFIKGGAQPVGKAFILDVHEYMNDNTNDSENSISFEYAYETLAGEVFAGTVTLPVQ